MSKKRTKKGMRSLLKQIRLHIPKLKEARAKGHYGFENIRLER